MKRFQLLYTGLWDTWRLIRMNLSLNLQMNILNSSSDETKLETVGSGVEVAGSLQKMILRLKGRYLSDDGKSVNYSLLRGDDLFKEFQLLSEQLAYVTLSDIPHENERKAFFINVYNTLTIHGLCKVDPLPKSLLDVTNFWKCTAYIINGLTFSLDDIEHGILRANTRHPSAISKPFNSDDPRLQFSMKELDPRIHLVLNCGGKSCPAISVYTESNLETALNNATSSFLSETVHISDGNIVHLSKLFQWYGSDFGATEKEILRWISLHLPETREEALSKLIESNDFKVVYDDYNWEINAQ